jgi:hypothetical protein
MQNRKLSGYRSPHNSAEASHKNRSDPRGTPRSSTCSGDGSNNCAGAPGDGGSHSCVEVLVRTQTHLVNFSAIKFHLGGTVPNSSVKGQIASQNLVRGPL